MPKFIFIYLLLISLFLNLSAYGMESNALLNSNNSIPNLVYYDADNIYANRDTGFVTLEGNATFLLGNVYLSARKITVQKNEQLVTCEGNVQIIYNKEKATASKIVFDLVTKQMRMDNAEIFSDPSATDEKANEDILGLTKAEIAFDQARNLRTQEIEKELKKIREEYVNLKTLKTIKKNDASIDLKLSDLSRRYSQLLARHTRTQYQPNSYFAGIPENEKQKLIDRRNAVEKFNRENPEFVSKITNFTPVPGYIKLRASQIIQKDKDNFILNDSFITPCHCSSFNEPPIYGFSAQKAEIEVGDYVTMQGTTFDIFSIPTFYLPWMKLPIKTKRATGFLYPSGYASNNAGQAISIPYFIVLGEHADSTITYDNFSTRGSRFSAELRTQFSDDSQLYTSGQYIADRLYHDDWLSNSNLVDQSIASTTNPSQQLIFASFRGIDAPQRWYTENSLNLPVSYFASIKGNAQFVSDNNYLSDFSPNINVNPVTAVFGNTSSSSRRFLIQETDGEYYGDNTTLSVRAQGLQDLFAQGRNNTPQRMPKIEFNLLSDRYFNTPLVFNNNSTWEKITRFGASPFIAIPPQTAGPSQPTLVPVTPAGQKNVLDPYVEGNRLYSTSTLTLPLQSNEYVNASLAVQATGVQYSFPAADPYGPFQAAQGYLQYTANLNAPMYARHYFLNQYQQETGSITQNFTPFVNLSYIPNVIRDVNYPTTYNLWYAQDNVASSAYLTVGASTSWRIKKEKYHDSEKNIERLLQTKDPGVANLNYFSRAIKDEKLNVPLNGKELFQFSSENESLKIYDLWAQNELDGYYQNVLADELNQTYIWPQGNYYELKSDLDITPVSVSVSTNYNFLAQQTANELNSIAGPNFNSPYPVTTYGDIIGTLSWDLSPFFPLNGSFSTSYSQVYTRINTAGGSIAATLPYGFAASYSHNFIYILSPTSPSIFILTTQRVASFTYTPKNWLQFGFQWAKNTDPSTPPTTDMSQGRDYASSYNINFINVQDCLDIIVSRNKAAGTPEGQATYAIGLNLKIFGFSTSYPQVADYLNRALQKQ